MTTTMNYEPSKYIRAPFPLHCRKELGWEDKAIEQRKRKRQEETPEEREKLIAQERLKIKTVAEEHA